MVIIPDISQEAFLCRSGQSRVLGSFLFMLQILQRIQDETGT